MPHARGQTLLVKFICNNANVPAIEQQAAGAGRRKQPGPVHDKVFLMMARMVSAPQASESAAAASSLWPMPVVNITDM